MRNSFSNSVCTYAIYQNNLFTSLEVNIILVITTSWGLIKNYNSILQVHVIHRFKFLIYCFESQNTQHGFKCLKALPDS